MAKKILGLMGSPCINGNASALLDAVLDGARSMGAQVERLNVTEMDIHPCDDCGKCDSGDTCRRFQDDMSKIYGRVRKIDALVLSSPVYFMGVSAQMKALIDRCQCFWTERYVMGKRAYEGKPRPRGIFTACAGSDKPSVFEPSLRTVRAFFLALDYDYAGEVFLGNTDDPEIESKRVPVLRRAFEAGVDLCR